MRVARRDATPRLPQFERKDYAEFPVPGINRRSCARRGAVRCSDRAKGDGARGAAGARRGPASAIQPTAGFDAAGANRTGTNSMTDGFARHLRLDQVRDGERLDLVADEEERAGIAKRLDLPRLER